MEGTTYINPNKFRSQTNNGNVCCHSFGKLKQTLGGNNGKLKCLVKFTIVC